MIQQQTDLYPLLDQFAHIFKTYTDERVQALEARVTELEATIAAMMLTGVENSKSESVP